MIALYIFEDNKFRFNKDQTIKDVYKPKNAIYSVDIDEKNMDHKDIIDIYNNFVSTLKDIIATSKSNIVSIVDFGWDKMDINKDLSCIPLSLSYVDNTGERQSYALATDYLHLVVDDAIYIKGESIIRLLKELISIKENKYLVYTTKNNVFDKDTRDIVYRSFTESTKNKELKVKNTDKLLKSYFVDLDKNLSKL